MREELRRSVSIGNLQGIQHILKLIFDDEITTQDAISGLCSFVSSCDLNYTAALLLFDEIGIIHLDNNIELTEYGRKMQGLSSDARLINIGKRIIEKVLDENLLNSRSIKYSTMSAAIEIPNNAFVLSAAVYRNFLIQINALYVGTGKLYVGAKFEQFFEGICEKKARKLTQEELLKRLEQQQADGEKAELFVIDYENRRLESYGKKAKRISQVDVSAGYDIMSYQNGDSKNYDIFIEVKSYTGRPHFYWSQNERNTSQALRERYFIYLVDQDQISNPEYSPIIIQDPNNTLSTETWIIRPESYFICQIC